MKKIFTLLALTFAFFSVCGCATAPPPPPPPYPSEGGIERWADNHPEAAADLGNWVKNHPQAARRFFEWDGTHPERSKMFVTWAITHPAEGVGVFIKEHPGWPIFDEIMERHFPAAQAFVFWCRHHPEAAEALMNHPRGLQWAGNHLYRAQLEMSHP